MKTQQNLNYANTLQANLPKSKWKYSNLCKSDWQYDRKSNLICISWWKTSVLVRGLLALLWIGLFYPVLLWHRNTIHFSCWDFFFFCNLLEFLPQFSEFVLHSYCMSCSQFIMQLQKMDRDLLWKSQNTAQWEQVHIHQKEAMRKSKIELKKS